MKHRAYAAYILPAILMTLLLTAGCGSKAPVSTDTVRSELVDKEWVMEKMIHRLVRGEEDLTLKFMADGTVQGFTGCNNFTGKYMLEGDALSFGPLAVTKKACAGSLGEQEFVYLGFLEQVSRVEVDGGDLELYLDGNPTPIEYSTGGGLW